MAIEAKLTCRDFIEFLSDYIDGDLSQQQKSKLDEHLDNCPHCKSYLDSYNKTIQLASSAARTNQIPDEVPDELIEAILAARKV